VGAEALIRWLHPTRGVLSPAAFLPQLEGGVLAEAAGTWVNEAASAELARWRDIRPDFRVSVNLFAAQFRSGRLPGVVRDALAARGLPGEALELEITENIILDDAAHLLAQLNELRALGIRLSFDDFGTGFASLNMLRTYPVTDIKIDRSFTQVIQTSPKDRAIILALLDLAEQFQIGVVAEGVERQEDHEFLRAHGCTKGQGYLYSKPAPAPVFEDWLRRSEAATSGA
jgi:EAL domain-containing protein (putative c-di-GMP-specific phosphodiesterase class I)